MAETNSTDVDSLARAAVERIRRAVGDHHGFFEGSIAPGIKCIASRRGWRVEGPLDRLLAAALVKASWFATGEDPAVHGGRVRCKRFSIADRTLETETRKGSRRVSVTVLMTEDERVDDKQHDPGRAVRHALANAGANREAFDRELAQSPEAWRDELLRRSVGAARILIVGGIDGYGAKRFCGRDRTAIVNLFTRIESIIRRADIVCHRPAPQLRVIAGGRAIPNSRG